MGCPNRINGKSRIENRVFSFLVPHTHHTSFLPETTFVGIKANDPKVRLVDCFSLYLFGKSYPDMKRLSFSFLLFVGLCISLLCLSAKAANNNFDKDEEEEEMLLLLCATMAAIAHHVCKL